MGTNTINRRQLISAAVALGAAGAISGESAAKGGTPLPSAEEMAAIEQALGKKGNLVQEQAVYTVPPAEVTPATEKVA